MLDKDFDQLFRDKFDSFESAPSSSTWGKITAQLEGKPGKSFPLSWVAAASIASVLILGFWLRREDEPVKLYAKADKVETTKPVDILEPVAVEISEKKSEPKSVKLSLAGRAPEKRRKLDVIPANLHEPENKSEEPELFLSSQEPDSRTFAAVNLDARTADQSPVIDANEFQMAILCDPQEDCNSEQNSPRPRSKIKSVGDLVNFVVSKVDKRKDKIIEFTSDEEGNVVSGINLGLVHFKSKE